MDPGAQLLADWATEGTACPPSPTAGPGFSEAAGRAAAPVDTRALQCPPPAVCVQPLWTEPASGIWGQLHSRGTHGSFNSVRTCRSARDALGKTKQTGQALTPPMSYPVSLSEQLQGHICPSDSCSPPASAGSATSHPWDCCPFPDCIPSPAHLPAAISVPTYHCHEADCVSDFTEGLHQQKGLDRAPHRQLLKPGRRHHCLDSPSPVPWGRQSLCGLLFPEVLERGQPPRPL